jgi:two-component system sensor histidine kinase PilS (NtrC family)
MAGVSDTSNYSAAGVLGAIIFAISLAARPLARRIQFSEALARQRGVDLANLSELNEYIVQHLRESIVVVDADDRVRLMNSSAALLLGAPVDCHDMQLADASKGLTEIIRTHAERVSHIIDNVLRLSRRESSRPERFMLAPWLDDFAQEFTRTLELREGELSIAEVAENLEIRMDPSHLRQVMWNLCDNAVKYASETGGIMVELQAGQTRRTGQPYLEVLDHGLGIEPQTVDKIFEPFYTDRSGGTGLGLYISRELCELNRATLVFQPRETGGSIFRIVFADPERWQGVAS